MLTAASRSERTDTVFPLHDKLKNKMTHTISTHNVLTPFTTHPIKKTLKWKGGVFKWGGVSNDKVCARVCSPEHPTSHSCHQRIQTVKERRRWRQAEDDDYAINYRTAEDTIISFLRHCASFWRSALLTHTLALTQPRVEEIHQHQHHTHHCHKQQNFQRRVKNDLAAVSPPVVHVCRGACRLLYPAQTQKRETHAAE